MSPDDEQTDDEHPRDEDGGIMHPDLGYLHPHRDDGDFDDEPDDLDPPDSGRDWDASDDDDPHDLDNDNHERN